MRTASLLLLATVAATMAPARPADNPLDRIKPVPADQPIPTIDFFRPFAFTAPSLNPAGTHIAARVSTGADRIDAAVLDLKTLRPERLTAGKDGDIATLRWLGNSHVLFNVSKFKLYSYGLFAAELGRLDAAYTLESHSLVVPIGFPRDNPAHVLLRILASAIDEGNDAGVIKIDATKRPANSFHALHVGSNPGIGAKVVRSFPIIRGTVTAGYLAGSDGELAYAITVGEGRETLHRLADNTWEPCPVDLDAVEIVATSDRPGELIVREPRQPDRPRALRRLDPSSGQLGDVLFRDETYDIVDPGLYRRPSDGRLLGVQFDRKGPDMIWIDPEYEAFHARLQARLPDQPLRILGSDDAEKNFLVCTYSDTRPPSYYHVDRANEKLRPIANAAPWIDPSRMRPKKVLTYKARDGRKIEGYLTLPDGASKEHPSPLVVLPHGGPWARDVWAWDGETQFLASRGYAVFQPNYRGSDGTAWRFPAEDQWDFLKMHDDVTDGVHGILRTGLLDPDRVAIMGGSFGGYLALSGVVREPALYRCAVSIAGVFDWERVLKEDSWTARGRASAEIMRRHLGDPKREKERFEDISPLRSVDQVKVPVFVAHGGEDVVASASQSRRLISELRKYGVPVEALFENDEGHGFRQLENQVRLYEQIEKFLATHLAARATAP